MPTNKHDRIAEAIARKLRTQYNPTKGADVVSSERAVEVEIDAGGLARGIEQLQGYNQLRYLGVPNRLVPTAAKRTRGTKIGVMNASGNIVKRAQRPAKKRR